MKVLRRAALAIACITVSAACGRPEVSVGGATPSNPETSVSPASPLTSSGASTGISLPDISREAIDDAVDVIPSGSTVLPPGTGPPAVSVATDPAPAVSDASMLHAAAALDLDGPIEHRDGEHGVGQCIGRLEPSGLCIDVPTWGSWTYWDLDAQNGPGATDEQAAATAIDFFTRLGIDPGDIVSVERNGPLLQVQFASGASVMVAAEERIAMLIAPTPLLPIP